MLRLTPPLLLRALLLGLASACVMQLLWPAVLAVLAVLAVQLPSLVALLGGPSGVCGPPPRAPLRCQAIEKGGLVTDRLKLQATEDDGADAIKCVAARRAQAAACIIAAGVAHICLPAASSRLPCRHGGGWCPAAAGSSRLNPQACRMARAGGWLIRYPSR